MKTATLCLAVFGLANAALAADITGTYVGVVKLPIPANAAPNANQGGNGGGRVATAPLPFVAHLKQQGGAVTGVLDGINGAPDVQIADGKVDGDTITFSATRQINGMDVKFNYSATVMGDMVDFKIVRADGQGTPLESLTTRLTTVP